MKDEFSALLEKEMDRKDFLKHVGIGFAVITGAATMLKTLNGFGGSSKTKTGSASSAGYGYGYGASSYGGGKGLAQQTAARATYS